MEVELSKDYFVLSENVRGHFKVERINTDGTVRGWPIDACKHNYAQDLKDISVNDIRMPWADWVARVNTVKSELFSQRLSDADYRKWSRNLLDFIEMEGRGETCPCCGRENAEHRKNCLLKLLRGKHVSASAPTEENYIFWYIFRGEDLDSEESSEVSEIVGTEILLRALRDAFGPESVPIDRVADWLSACSRGEIDHPVLNKLRFDDVYSDDGANIVTILIGHTPVGEYICNSEGLYTKFSIGNLKLIP